MQMFFWSVCVCVCNNLKLTGLTPTGLDENRRDKEYWNMENFGIFILPLRAFEGIAVTSLAGALSIWYYSPEESYRPWCVVVGDLETSWMRRYWPTGGLSRQKQTYEQPEHEERPCNYCGATLRNVRRMCLCCSVTFCGVQILFRKMFEEFLTKYFFRLLSMLVFPHLLDLVPTDMASLFGYKYGWPLTSFPFC
jgi:hypothetical protein